MRARSNPLRESGVSRRNRSADRDTPSIPAPADRHHRHRRRRTRLEFRRHPGARRPLRSCAICRAGQFTRHAIRRDSPAGRSRPRFTFVSRQSRLLPFRLRIMRFPAILAASITISALAADRPADAKYLTIQDPIVVYNDWSSYDELSDRVPLTEQLAMKEMDNLLRLKRHGVPFDYYMMDAFWFAKDGGYRTWRKETWPNGPDNWLKKCRENGIKPGMWFGTNLLVQLDPVPAWEDSLTKNRGAMCMFKGGFLPHFMDTLQMWYDRGVRMFKFDFVAFDAAPPDIEASMSREEIRRRNEEAFRDALKKFREKNAGVVLVAFNGFG